MKRRRTTEIPKRDVPLLKFLITSDLVNYLFAFINVEHYIILKFVSKDWQNYFGSKTILEFDVNACASVAFDGYLNLLKWVRENGCPWDENTCSGAAYGGHLDCLTWARQNDCPWNFSTGCYAATNGHLDCLKWTLENGCDWNINTYFQAINNGHLDCAIWLKENGYYW